MFVGLLGRNPALHGYQFLKAAPEHALAIKGHLVGVKIGHIGVFHDFGIHSVPVLAEI